MVPKYVLPLRVRVGMGVITKKCNGLTSVGWSLKTKPMLKFAYT